MESIQEKFNRLINIIPEPVEYGLITYKTFENESIENKTVEDEITISYTDCFEISLLRFLHLVFGKDGEINLDYLNTFMDDSEQCNRLYKYFINNNMYYVPDEYYKSKDGFVERANWCKFLNESKCFHYKKSGKYELCASIENLVTFFKTFFPKIQIKTELLELNYENIKKNKIFQNYRDVLGEIYSQLNFNYNFEVSLRYKIEYKPDKIYMMLIQKIYVDEFLLYEWEIYQFYGRSEDIITERITGHSELRFNQDCDSDSDSYIDSDIDL
jgi:hypothetical protein